jgi:hypothetical protein
MNDICFELRHLGGPTLALLDKAANNPPSTTIPPLFLRELRGEVRENAGRVEDAYPAKINRVALSRLSPRQYFVHLGEKSGPRV